MSQYKEILRLKSLDCSISEMARRLNLSKSTVLKHFNRLQAASMTWEEAKDLSEESLTERVIPKFKAKQHRIDPDWEKLIYEQDSKRLSLWDAWNRYKEMNESSTDLLSYSAFCRRYKKYRKENPHNVEDMIATMEWEPGDAIQIDYSGDGLYYIDIDTGERKEAQVFLGCLAYSNYMFCYATKRQTRDDWLDAIIEMFRFFDGVARYIYLDNSTSLVTKASKYDPKICTEFKSLCDYYGTIGYPVAPNSPRHKAAVERISGLYQQWIRPELVTRRFFSIEDLNTELAKEVAKANLRQLHNKLEQSRYDRYMKEQAYLLSHPALPYEKSTIVKELKVRKESCIRLGNHRYSVPYIYINEKVKVLSFTRKGVLRIYNPKTGEEIATHNIKTESDIQQNSIKLEHMPAHIQEVYEDSSEKLKRLKAVGPSTEKLSKMVINGHDKKRAARILQGMVSTLKRIGKKAMELCCESAIEFKQHTFEGFQKVVSRYDERQEATRALRQNKKMNLNASSKNIRGSAHYKRKDQDNG